MNEPFRRGRLRDASEAPATGELVDEVLAFRNAVVDQILSGQLEAPADYLQSHDEWVVVLAGGATLEVDGEPVELAAREWLLLPSGVPHRLLATEPGTEWLAVHVHARDSGA